VRGQILAGSVNDATWKSKVNDPSKWGLKNIGAENQLGQDGIRWTPDDSVNWDTNGDGVPDSTGYDADADGTVRTTNYSYDNEIKMTTGNGSRADRIQGYPTDSTTGAHKDFTTLATNAVTLLQGIFYTNHAIGLYTSKSMALGGALVCRDEAINYSGTITFNYDWRIHSRNHHKFYDGNGNKIIDLSLPVAYQVRLYDRKEIANQ
jgi:hypothetical protein